MKVLVNLFGASTGAWDWDTLTGALQELIKSMLPPILAIMSALAIVFAAVIAWSFWSAGGDETKVQKAKANVKWYVIGWFALFIVIVATPILINVLSAWSTEYGV